MDVISRKVVRDSIRGISELKPVLGKRLMADEYCYHSDGGHSVCTVFSMLAQGCTDGPSQSSGTQRRHQTDLGNYIR